jgi:Protein of unknown function (DUF3467)
MAENTPQELSTTRTEKFVRVYANAANMDVTPWDFKIAFGELKKSDGKMVIEQTVEVTMSPQHAKALAEMLGTNVRQYEEQVGEIKLPKMPEASPARSSMPMPTAAGRG